MGKLLVFLIVCQEYSRNMKMLVSTRLRCEMKYGERVDFLDGL